MPARWRIRLTVVRKLEPVNRDLIPQRELALRASQEKVVRQYCLQEGIAVGADGMFSLCESLAIRVPDWLYPTS